jgi:hypothetical protein
LVIAYGTASLFNRGWNIQGGGASATKASFNLINGFVEYDVDFSSTNVGVNANIYTISPMSFPSNGFNQNYYCDGAKTGSSWCTEVDWIETNGNCGGASTLHTVEGTGNNGCTAWGCQSTYYYSGKSSFHMRVEFASDGTWVAFRDGVAIAPLTPTPSSNDWNVLKTALSTSGAVIYSSQWTGWVPASSCGTAAGDLSTSSFSVSNLQIYGAVMQGPTPTRC